MKINSLILLAVPLFFLMSCDLNTKFDNPYDRNSEAYIPENEEETDVADNDTKPDEDVDAAPDSGSDEDNITESERIAACEGLPENAEWSGYDKITQTWNGTEWQPTTQGSFGENAVDNECLFKCIEHCTWNGSECVMTECSPTSGTPCMDSASGLIWSSRSADEMSWYDAGSYCENLGEGGYTDWRLPNIDEVRTLLISSRVAAECKVSEVNNCLGSSCWDCESCTDKGIQLISCDYKIYDGDGYSYNKLGDRHVVLWSSSTVSDYTHLAWRVSFIQANVDEAPKDNDLDVRCVR